MTVGHGWRDVPRTWEGKGTSCKVSVPFPMPARRDPSQRRKVHRVASPFFRDGGSSSAEARGSPDGVICVAIRRGRIRIGVQRDNVSMKKSASLSHEPCLSEHRLGRTTDHMRRKAAEHSNVVPWKKHPVAVKEPRACILPERTEITVTHLATVIEPGVPTALVRDERYSTEVLPVHPVVSAWWADRSFPATGPSG